MNFQEFFQQKVLNSSVKIITTSGQQHIGQVVELSAQGIIVIKNAQTLTAIVGAEVESVQVMKGGAENE